MSTSDTKSGGPPPCCQVEAVMTVDERGQTVLPKALREKLGISAGDKLAAVAMERDGCACCLALIKVDDLSDMVKGFLGPIMSDVLGD